ncbi:MAG: glycosyltransferase [Marinilabiliaceae bacterium]|nr:glycosyltransferase [Marinilabiliaceae bacterium]
MRICFCNTIKSWGGGEKWHYEMATELANINDYQISFITNNKSQLAKKLSSHLITPYFISIGNISFLNPFKTYKLITYFKKNHFDAVILNSPSELKTVAIAAKIVKIKKIIYRRGSDVVVKNSFLNRFLLEKVVTTIIANSNATKESLLKTGLNISDKIYLIPNGIKPPSIIKSSPETDTVIIGAIGRLAPEKGFDLLIDICKLLRDQKLNFKIKIAGSGNEESNLRNQIEQHQLNDIVELVGFVNDPFNFLSQCDIFALSSRYEGFGYVVVEAMFAKKPVVAFDISSVRDLIYEGETGYIVPAYQINAFADKVKQLLLNKETRISFGEKGSQIAFEKFNFKTSLEHFLNVITS